MNITPAIYDPKRYPKQAKRADRYLAESASEDKVIEQLVARHGFARCTHPDCDPTVGALCATNSFYNRATALARAVIRYSKRTRQGSQ